MEEDAADVKARRARELEAKRAEEELKKSAVLRKGLPRPLMLDGMPAPAPPAEVAAMSYREKAEHALGLELQVGFGVVYGRLLSCVWLCVWSCGCSVV
jgi:hypothetical protein